MRQGEIFGLTRNRLRLLGTNPVVTVDRQLLTRLNRVTEFGPLKTRASYRTIPLPATVVDALNGHLAAHDIVDEDLIFTLEGRPITRQAFGHVWRPVAKVAGLNQATGPGMHALRHYYAHCSSGTANRSRRSRPGWGTLRHPRPSTPTATSGRTPTIGRGRRSTQSSDETRPVSLTLVRARVRAHHVRHDGEMIGI
jgi:integrase